MATAVKATMPKKNPDPKPDQPEPAKMGTKVAADVLKKGKKVAFHRGIDLYEYFDAILRPVVERDDEHRIREEAEGLGDE